MSPHKPSAGDLRLLRAAPGAEGLVQVLNMSRELSCTAKRVYLADLAHNVDGAGTVISAGTLAIELGLSGDQVEYARRSLVQDQLQIILDRPTGRTSLRVCLFPGELDPGPGADTHRCLAMAMMLDGWLLTNRRMTTTAPAGGSPQPLQAHR